MFIKDTSSSACPCGQGLLQPNVILGIIIWLLVLTILLIIILIILVVRWRDLKPPPPSEKPWQQQQPVSRRTSRYVAEGHRKDYAVDTINYPIWSKLQRVATGDRAGWRDQRQDAGDGTGLVMELVLLMGNQRMTDIWWLDWLTGLNNGHACEKHGLVDGTGGGIHWQMEVCWRMNEGSDVQPFIYTSFLTTGQTVDQI